MVEHKMNSKGLRKKLINGLVVDKWDLVNIIEKQEKEILKRRGEVLGLMVQIEMLKKFIKPILCHDEDAIGNWDGWDLEKLALETGLYYKVEMTEPCNTGREETHRCLCLEYGADFPDECNRVNKILLD